MINNSVAIAKTPQIGLFPEVEDIDQAEQDYSSTFADNMSLPIHKWFRYTAGFSAIWAKQLIQQEKKNGRTNIIDPFAGSGTVLIESDFEGVSSIGIESHPYIYRIANTKLQWNYSANKFREGAIHLLDIAKRKKINKTEYPKLIQTCFPEDSLKELEALKQSWYELEQEEELKNFTWFIITSILRSVSPVGTAQWQYVLPNKKKAKVLTPFVAFENKVHQIFLDITTIQKHKHSRHSQVFNEDARNIQSIPDKWGDLVITSPPYANNYDYADATRLEMTFWGDIEGWGDLQNTVRKNLIRACTQHVAGLGGEVDSILNDPKLECIKSELSEVYYKLKEERLNHGGKKNYHFMIAAYFHDLAQVFASLRRVTKEGALVCFVIGDSAPYGIYVPVDKWLGEIAVAAGFKEYSFEKLRDRNVKWKNRKHRVPLKEGRLWING
jgi:DNA modification methylase